MAQSEQRQPSEEAIRSAWEAWNSGTRLHQDQVAVLAWAPGNPLLSRKAVYERMRRAGYRPVKCRYAREEVAEVFGLTASSGDAA